MQHEQQKLENAGMDKAQNEATVKVSDQKISIELGSQWPLISWTHTFRKGGKGVRHGNCPKIYTAGFSG